MFMSILVLKPLAKAEPVAVAVVMAVVTIAIVSIFKPT